mmetsp:Transcript_47748/g.152340  ORF Transcript_47748/g.152340 Transcript_47748/m.152340 type:complete len:238 (+) Transcript_47748:392-1105(+)
MSTKSRRSRGTSWPQPGHSLPSVPPAKRPKMQSLQYTAMQHCATRACRKSLAWQKAHLPLAARAATLWRRSAHGSSSAAPPFCCSCLDTGAFSGFLAVSFRLWRNLAFAMARASTLSAISRTSGSMPSIASWQRFSSKEGDTPKAWINALVASEFARSAAVLPFWSTADMLAAAMTQSTTMASWRPRSAANISGVRLPASLTLASTPCSANIFSQGMLPSIAAAQIGSRGRTWKGMP